jgi:hypothetical protein
MRKKIYLQDVVDDKMRGVLSLFVSEIQEIIASDKIPDDRKGIEITTLMHYWIQGCKLTPEKVRQAPKEISDKVMRGEAGIEALFEWLESSP